MRATTDVIRVLYNLFEQSFSAADSNCVTELNYFVILNTLVVMRFMAILLCLRVRVQYNPIVYSRQGMNQTSTCANGLVSKLSRSILIVLC